MNLRIQSRIGVQTSADRIWSLIEDLSYWDRWNPIETGVSGHIAFGGQIALTERIDGLPERQVQYRVAEWQPRAQLVLAEKRGWQFNALRFFEIDELEPGNCIFANGLVLSGFRGESFHDKHRRVLRTAYDEVSQAIKAAAEAG